MKKLFVVLAVASLGFVACNNDSKTETEDAAKKAADSARVADSLKALAPATSDTTHKGDSANKMAPDSSSKTKK
jgi:hypothetical protein